MSAEKPSTAIRHIAIIMDGNGRWAKQRHLSRTVGHVKGAAVVRDLVKFCADMGVPHLTLYAFSTENWQRPIEEVSALMSLSIQYLEKEMTNMRAEGVRLKVLGDVSRFPPELQQRIRDAEANTLSQPKITLNIAANYGGRWDIVQAVQAWLQEHPVADESQLSVDSFGQYLSTAGMPDVDLMIRTGGESRISNFLLWQAAYAELYFTDILWPDFEINDLKKAIDWYSNRDRRFGAL